MPYRSERVRIAGTRHDLRRKLTDDQVSAIRLLKSEGYSYRRLAAMFGCSKWSVQNIINPQPRKKDKKRPTVYWTEKKRQYRQRKQALFKSGIINERTRRKRKHKD